MSEEETSEDDCNNEKEDRGPPMMGGSAPPQCQIVLGKGDVQVTVTGDDSTSFHEAVHACHNEAQHFADEAVFIDEADRVDQYIHRGDDSEKW